jgi:hypothetical protein
MNYGFKIQNFTILHVLALNNSFYQSHPVPIAHYAKDLPSTPQFPDEFIENA